MRTLWPTCAPDLPLTCDHKDRGCPCSPWIQLLTHQQGLCVLPPAPRHSPAARAAGDVIVRAAGSPTGVLPRCLRPFLVLSVLCRPRTQSVLNEGFLGEWKSLIGSAVPCRGSPFCPFLRSPLETWQRGDSSVRSLGVRTSSGSWIPCIQSCTCPRTGLASLGWWASWAYAGLCAPGLQEWPGLLSDQSCKRKAPLWGQLTSLICLPLLIRCPSFSPWVSGPQVQNVSTGSI